MRHQALHLTILATATVSLGLGCSQMYNGSFGMGSRDKEAVEAYQAFRAEREQKLAEAAAAGTLEVPAQAAPLRPGLPVGGLHVYPVVDAPAQRSDEAPGQQAATFETPAVSPSQTQGRSGRATLPTFGLYGDATPVRRQAGSSPMDGPGNLRRVTFTAEGADFDVTVDPNGEFMVYASTRHRDTADIYAKKIQGTALKLLTNDPANDVMPAISPDGSKIAFASDRGGNWDIYVMDAEGGHAIQLTSDFTQDIHPTWSPDGTQIAYCSYGAANEQWELVLIDVANPAVKRYLTHGLFPTWHPTDNRILFQRARQRGTKWFSVWTVDISDGEATMPTEVAASANAALITPDWSPDGHYIVFSTVIDPTSSEADASQADLWIMREDGSSRAKLTTGQFANLQPTWSPDGGIYFVSDRARGGVENVWMLDPSRAVNLHGPAGPRARRSAEAPAPSATQTAQATPASVQSEKPKAPPMTQEVFDEALDPRGVTEAPQPQAMTREESATADAAATPEPAAIDPFLQQPEAASAMVPDQR